MNETTDHNLVIACQNGSKAAYADLVRRYYKKVYLICLGMLGNAHDAEDVAQETMMKGFEQIVTLRQSGRFGSWISQIAKNACINVLRKRQTAKKVMDNNVVKAENDRPIDNLHRAIEKLPQDLRIPLVLYFFDGQNVKSVAEKLNMSASNVYLKLRTATQQLHNILTAQGGSR